MDSAARSGPRYLDEAFDILEARARSSVQSGQSFSWRATQWQEMQLQDMSADKCACETQVHASQHVSSAFHSEIRQQVHGLNLDKALVGQNLR